MQLTNANNSIQSQQHNVHQYSTFQQKEYKSQTANHHFLHNHQTNQTDAAMRRNFQTDRRGRTWGHKVSISATSNALDMRRCFQR